MLNLPKVVGYNIREIRKAKGWTQEELAEKSSLHYSYIGGVERGERNISLETLEKIINAFHITPTELFITNDNNEHKDRQLALEQHITLMMSRTSDEIKMISKINRDMLKAIDFKNDDGK